jgi:hypothetical protein
MTITVSERNSASNQTVEVMPGTLAIRFSASSSIQMIQSGAFTVMTRLCLGKTDPKTSIPVVTSRLL